MKGSKHVYRHIAFGLLLSVVQWPLYGTEQDSVPISVNVIDNSIGVTNTNTDTIVQNTYTDNISYNSTDTIAHNADSISVNDSIPPKPKKIDAPISYVANDSIVLLGNGTAILHGQGKVNYQTMELSSEYIRVNMDSSLIYACGIWDSIEEEWIGLPNFKDKSDSYESNEMTYNIKTRKGYIRHVVTEQGEGYVTADRTKKANDKDMMMAGGMYTTCDHHDHPHFYLKMTKAKVRPGEHISTGPAYMVVGDVPLPLAIPFGFFPFTKSYSSGIIMPSFGDDYTRGFYLRNLGYYFAFNDYVDLEINGDIYTRGTWAIYAKSKYIKRYKYNGNISLNYRCDVTGDSDMPDYTKATNFSIIWNHTQDSKANPYNNFSASVNFSTSGYNRSNINSYYNAVLNSENTKSSSISYTQRFPDSPWSLSMSMLLSQRTKDSTISATLPDLTVSMSRIYPFKKKQRSGKEKWYEKISLQYNGNARIEANSIKEDQFFRSDFLRDWQTGIKHSLSTSATFMLFKYLSLTPTISLTDRMYFQRETRTWDDTKQKLDTTYSNGFYNVFDFSASLTLSTKIYGFYTPIRKLFPNGKLEKIRHVLTPHISMSYHPDFGKSFWGYYGSYNQQIMTTDDNGNQVPKLDNNGNPIIMTNTYSRFSKGIYGNAGQGTAAKLTFGVDNNLEAKILNKKDTTGKEQYKIISIIDNLSIGGGYNFAADSMRWDNFSISLRIKVPATNYTINLNTELDPYMYQLDAAGNPHRTNKQYWHNGRFPHWTGTSTDISYTFNNQLIRKWFGGNNSTGKGHTDDGNMEPVTINESGSVNNGRRKNNDKDAHLSDDDGYERVEIPWSLTIGYSIAYRATDKFDYEKMYYKMGLRHSLSISGTLALGTGWKLSASTHYDFDTKQFTYTNFTVNRDLHCWNMSASFVPFGPYKSYTFHIGVNASMLADLKYDKSSVDNTNKKVTWW